MSSGSAFFIGLLIGVVVVVITFYAVYRVNTKQQVQTDGAAESYTSFDRDKTMPRWFVNDDDKLTKQFLKGKVRMSAQENYAKISNDDKQKYIDELIS